MNTDKTNKPVENQEDFILKKIRYYQGSIKDFETYWNKKISQGESEESKETKSFKKTNADLNKAFEIIPVKPDDNTPENEPKDESDKVEKKKEKKVKTKKENIKDKGVPVDGSSCR